MKTFVWTDWYSHACPDSDCERYAAEFLDPQNPAERMTFSNELLVTAARALVAEGKAEPFQVIYPSRDEPVQCRKDGTLSVWPKETDTAMILLRRIIAGKRKKREDTKPTDVDQCVG